MTKEIMAYKTKEMEKIVKQCLGRLAQGKKFSVTFYLEEFEHNNVRVNSPQDRYMKGKRQSTVEPSPFWLDTSFTGPEKAWTQHLSD